MQREVLDFWRHAERHPDDIALVDEAGLEWPAHRLFAETNRISNGLQALAIGKGSVVATLMPKCGRLVALSLATSQIGALLMTLNPGMSLSEVEYLLADSDASILVLDPTCAREDLQERLDRLALPKIAVGERTGWQPYEEAFGNCAVDPPSARACGALLAYTSGTTGRPKGVLRQWSHRPPELIYFGMIDWFMTMFSVRPRDGVHLCTCPLHYAAPMFFSSYALHMGHKLVLMPTWHPRLALQLIEKHRVTTAFMVPFQFLSLLKLPEQTRESFSTSSLRAVIHGSAPCPVQAKAGMLRWWGDILFESYGATEVGATVASPDDSRKFPGTVGRATLPHEVKILDERGRELPAGQAGAIYMRVTEASDFVYKGDPEKTKNSRHGDFATVGDIGYLNDEGYLFLLDRRTDMIACRGEHIYPAELEGVLATHPLVADCAAFGIPHPEWGEEVRMAIQLAPDVARSAEVDAQILDFLRARLGSTKCPRGLDYLPALPRDAGGKLRRRELRTPYWTEAGRHI